MNQKEQQAVVRDFRSQQFNVLVATCIAEEGLDVGSVDMCVSYDVVTSTTRAVQRKGRTARKQTGKSINLVTEGAEEGKLNTQQQRQRSIFVALRRGMSQFHVYRRNPNMLPPDLDEPALVEKRLDVEDFALSQVGGTGAAARKARDGAGAGAGAGGLQDSWRVTGSQHDRLASKGFALTPGTDRMMGGPKQWVAPGTGKRIRYVASKGGGRDPLTGAVEPLTMVAKRDVNRCFDTLRRRNRLRDVDGAREGYRIPPSARSHLLFSIAKSARLDNWDRDFGEFGDAFRGVDVVATDKWQRRGRGGGGGGGSRLGGGGGNADRQPRSRRKDSPADDAFVASTGDLDCTRSDAEDEDDFGGGRGGEEEEEEEEGYGARSKTDTMLDRFDDALLEDDPLALGAAARGDGGGGGGGGGRERVRGGGRNDRIDSSTGSSRGGSRGGGGGESTSSVATSPIGGRAKQRAAFAGGGASAGAGFGAGTHYPTMNV